MTKRWLSLVVVLTLLVSCFAGAAAEDATTAKGVGTYVVSFIPAEDIEIKEGDDKSVVLGQFQLDNGSVSFAAGLDYNFSAFPNKVTVKAGDTVLKGSEAGFTGLAKAVDIYGNLRLSWTDITDIATVETKLKDGLTVSVTGVTGAWDAMSAVAVPVTVVRPITEMTGLDFHSSFDQHENEKMVVGSKADGAGYIYLFQVDVKPVFSTALVTGSDPYVKWESSDETILKLNQSAVAYNQASSGVGRHYIGGEALKAGKVTITASSKNSDKKATFDVEVINKLPSSAPQIVIYGTQTAAADGTLYRNESVRLAAKWSDEPTDPTGVWSVDSDASSSYYSFDPDTATLTNKNSSGSNIKVKVTFTSNANANKTASVTYTLSNSNNTDVPTVTIIMTDSQGKVLTNKDVEAHDTVTITMTCPDPDAKIYYLTDTNEISGTIFEETSPSSGTYKPATNAKLYEAPIVVDADCVQTYYKANAIKDGKIGKSATTRNLKVTHYITGITASPASVTLNGSQEATVTLTLAGVDKVATDNVDVTTSGGDGYVTVTNGEGYTYTFTGKKAGTTNVTFTETNSKKSVTVPVTVNGVAVSGIALSQTSLNVAQGNQTTLSVNLTPSNGLYDSITWKSSDGSVVGVTDNGKTATVTGVQKGGPEIITVTVKSSDGSTYVGTCSVTVGDKADEIGAPVFSIASGTTFTTIPTAGNVVKLSTTAADATIRYTTSIDGAEPAEPKNDSKEYTTAGITIDPRYDMVIIKAATFVSGGQSDTVTAIYYNDIAATDVTIKDTNTTGGLKNGALSVNDGTTYSTLSVEVKPTDAKLESKATVTSSDETVAKVKYTATDGKIELTALKPGTTTITATCGSQSDSFVLTVKEILPATVTVTAKDNATTIALGETLQLTAKVTGSSSSEASDQSVTWTSSKPEVISVDANGLATALAASTETVTITAETVTKGAAGVTIRGDIKLTVGAAKTQARAPELQYLDDDGKWTDVTSTTFNKATQFRLVSTTAGSTIYYTTDGSAVSTTSPVYGQPFTLSATTTIRAMATAEGKANSAVVTKVITMNLAVTGITLDKTTADIEVGDELSLTASLLPEGATGTIKWTVDAAYFAPLKSTTGATNTLTAKNPGKVTVTASVTVNGSEKKATCVVTISEVGITGVSVYPTSLSLMVSKSTTLGAVVAPNTADQSVVWSSSDAKVATVNKNGMVTAVAAGTATITATSAVDSTKSATSVVTVVAAPTEIPQVPQKVPTFTPAATTFNTIEGASLTVKLGSFAPGTGETLEQILYYYNLSVETTTAALTNLKVVFTTDNNGDVYMTIPNVGKDDVTFSYTWKAKGTNGLSGTESRTVSGNKLVVTKKPTAINFTANTVADTSLEGGATATLDFGTISNYSAFTATGVALTATANVSAEGITATAAIDSNGKVTATVEGLVKGEYTVTVTLSASGCTSVTTGAAKVTVTSDKPAPVPVEKAIVVTKGTAYEGIKGVTQLAKADNYVVFDVTGLDEGVTVTSWKSSKPAYVSIDEHGVATLKKAGKAKITATMSDNSKLSIDVNVNKGSFADPAKITLQTKPGNKWVDVTAEGITVVPKKSGQKSVPSRLNASDDGKIVIQDVEFSNGTIASRDGDNPSPIKVKKRSISDGETTTLTITANGAKFSVVIKVDSGAKDVYLEDVIAEIEEIIELEAE